jgi:hypothetical protein
LILERVLRNLPAYGARNVETVAAGTGEALPGPAACEFVAGASCPITGLKPGRGAGAGRESEAAMCTDRAERTTEPPVMGRAAASFMRHARGRAGECHIVARTARRDKVRELQRTLYRAAKADPRRRFHALYDEVHRREVLEWGWELVRANRGAAGIDRETIADVE